MKRMISIFLTMLLIGVLLLPVSASGTPTIAVSQEAARRGDSIDVTVSLQNNPGVITMRLCVNYDTAALTLTNVTDLALLPGQVHSPDYAASPYTLYWDNGASSTDYTANGDLVKLTFQVKDSATVGNHAVTVSYDAENYDVFNTDLSIVRFTARSGGVRVSAARLGDTNEDGERNAKDITILRRYLVGGYGVTVAKSVADVNGDGEINGKDVTFLRRCLAGGYGVSLD